MRLSLGSLLATSSVVALSAVGAISTAQPALAQDTTLGIYAGGSTLASQAFRQIFDCYAGKTVGGDGFTFSSAFSSSPPTPTLLPSNCTTWSITTSGHVEGLYAAVGSGNGFRAYISNLPDQWYGGNVTANTTVPTPFPSSPPPFVDSNNPTTFGTYPYPQLDIALSDAPLAINTAGGFTTLTTQEFGFTPSTNWSTSGGSITQVAVGNSTTVSYNAANFGQPIQLPAFEAGVAIAINTNATSGITWTIKSTTGTPTLGVDGAGSAIQLTDAQLCAIFSGLVTDWSSTQTIAYLTTATTPTLAAFDYANTINGTGTNHGTGQVAYVNASLPITVVFRSDGSGTSFIITNFLHNYCPLLDTGPGAAANGYSAIFGASNLPSTSFSNLVNNINGYTPPAGAPAHSALNFKGETGSGGVAGTIGNTAASAGYIGYVSADFTVPYSPSATAPLSASVQDENERINGANIPGGSSTDSGNFIAPTPASVDQAWLDSGLTTPAANTTTTPDFTLWNVYGQTYPTGTTHGGVNVSGKSVLALTFNSEAYPLAGTTFLAAYSCYATSTRSNQILTFFRWLYGPAGASNTDAIDIFAKNGFHVLQPGWGTNLYATYLNARSKNVISSAGVSGGGCPTGASGAL